MGSMSRLRFIAGALRRRPSLDERPEFRRENGSRTRNHAAPVFEPPDAGACTLASPPSAKADARFGAGFQPVHDAERIACACRQYDCRLRSLCAGRSGAGIGSWSAAVMLPPDQPAANATHVVGAFGSRPT